jgi:formylglycine-generating enzyme required for sulfatase activity
MSWMPTNLDATKDRRALPSWLALVAILAACGCGEPAPEPIELDWVALQGGEFQMGTDDRYGHDDEHPQHLVTVPSFEINRTEVTAYQYRPCFEAGACSEPVPHKPGTTGLCNWGRSRAPNHPINCLDWDMARTFCVWAGGRLPTEAEWEYAARGEGQIFNYPWSNTPATCEYSVMSSVELGFGCGKGESWPVCAKPEGNTLQGLCDMAGNVDEWIQDHYHDSYEGAPSDGSAWEDPGEDWEAKRVLRGSFYGGIASDLRVAARAFKPQFAMGGGIGFRCVRSIEE